MTGPPAGPDGPSSGAWRPGWSRPVEWLVLTGNRLVVSGVLLLVVAAAVWGVVLSGLAPLTERTPTLYLLFALVSGNFALITIVVSISQFVLARHLESPDEIRERMNEMVGYRREVGEATRRSVLPVTPSGFLLVLFGHIAGQVRELQGLASTVADERARREIAGLTSALGTHTERVVDALEASESGLEHALFVTLNASYATYIYRTWQLESERAAALSEEVTGLLGGLGRSLEQVDVARRFFKTVLIQSELASLSRLLLYIGVPVQLATVVIMLLFTAPPGAAVAPGVLSVVIPLVVTLGFAPIVILAAFILRLATVAERTAAMYPFTNGDGDDELARIGDGDDELARIGDGDDEPLFDGCRRDGQATSGTGDGVGEP